MSASGGERVSRRTRASLAVQVGLVALLAAALAALATELAGWRGLRWRWDLTLTRRNTLAEATREQIARLPAKATIDVFFRAEPGPYAALAAEVQSHALEIAELAAGLFPDRIALVQHDLADLAAVDARRLELGLEQVVNTLVVSSGARKVTLGLFDDLAQVDFGSLDPRNRVEPSVRAFLAEEALASALNQVAAADRPLIAWSSGHGEGDPAGEDERGLSRFARALEADGFELVPWEGQDPIPAGARVLAVVAPAKPLLPGEVEALRAFVSRGGSLLVVGGLVWFEGPGSPADLLLAYGMRAVRGVVCAPVYDAILGTAFEGRSECAAIYVGSKELAATHPVTEPLWKHKRRLLFPFTRSFERGQAPEGGVLLDLVSSPDDCWRDLPNADGTLDFALVQSREESGRFRLALSSQFPVAAEGASAGAPDVGPGAAEARVVGLLSPDAFSNLAFEFNRDFALNVANWLAERDFKVRVAARDPMEGRIDPARGASVLWAGRLASWVLPLACLATAGLVAWKRRR
jgi:hypothetical protein